MRIASLLPAATEWVCALGAASDLVARSHACDHPSEAVADVPVVTRPRLDTSGSSSAIDGDVRERLAGGLSLYDVDLHALRAAAPDLVLTQAQCRVCAVSLDELEQALAGWTDHRPRLVSLAPSTFKEVLDGALRLGRTIGRMDEAMRCIAAGEQRLRHLAEQLADRPRPSVALIEWMDPLMTASHWVPDLADHAGAEAVLAQKGALSQYVEPQALLEANPDVLVVAPCGFDLERTRGEIVVLQQQPWWETLRAVQEHRVYLADGDELFNRPGPRLYRSAEVLAALVHGEQSGVRVRSDEVALLRPDAASSGNMHLPMASA